MAETGQTLNQRDEIVSGFAEAMRMADIKYIAENGRFTPGMQIYWNRYVEWCYEYEKKSIQNGK